MTEREVGILEAAILARAAALAEAWGTPPRNLDNAEEAGPLARAFLEGRSTHEASKARLASEADLPTGARSVVVGHHFVLIGGLDCDPEPEPVREALRRYHTRLALDRSYLGPAGGDLLLILVAPAGADETEHWRERQAVIERDAHVCRKLMWLPPAQDPEGAAKKFLGRTFLARPWRRSKGSIHGDTDLDSMARIADRLVEKGLTAGEAAAWVDILSAPADDTDILESLVGALEPDA